jgi:hypothetical protein
MAATTWTNFYSGPANFNDQAKAIALDGGGNVYVTGQSFGNGTSYDYATIKYSSNGIAIWTNRFNGAGNSGDSALALAVDSSSNVFVTGQSYNLQGNLGFATIKYSSAGIALWTNLYSGESAGKILAVDTSGNVYVTGVGKTIKYSNAGVALWTNQFVGQGSVACSAIDGSGNLYLAGQSGRFCTVKYSGNGSGIWTNFFVGTANGSDSITSMAIDGSGNVLVTGGSYSSNYYLDYDYVTIKYSSAGVALWTNKYNGPTDDDDKTFAIGVDTNANVYVTGISFDRFSAGISCVTIKYSSNGFGLWTNYYGPSTMLANSLGVDDAGNVYLPASPRQGGAYNFAVIKYSIAGVALWTNIFNGPGNSDDLLSKLLVDKNGDVCLAGSSLTSANGYYYTTIKYLGNPPLPITLTEQLLGGSKIRISAVGLTGINYALERNFNLQSTNWIPQLTNLADSTGVLIFTNTPNPTTNNFWRIRSVP